MVVFGVYYGGLVWLTFGRFGFLGSLCLSRRKEKRKLFVFGLYLIRTGNVDNENASQLFQTVSVYVAQIIVFHLDDINMATSETPESGHEYHL